MNRPSWPDYFFDIAKIVKTRSTCLRRQVGAVIVKNNQILASGYNGAPVGIEHCQHTGCLRTSMDVPSGERHELCRGTHAEQNAIIQAAKHGIAINGATLFCTHQPCFICTKMIINAGIRNVFYQHPYGDPMAEAMLKQSNINLYLWRVQNGYDL